jgi:lipoprotein-anchoring transpeptidase ErfK/SrfK
MLIDGSPARGEALIRVLTNGKDTPMIGADYRPPTGTGQLVVSAARWRAHRWRLAALPRLALGLLLAISLLASVTTTAGASHDVGPDRVYFSQTGHYLSYSFLDYWHHHGDVEILGYPVTEEFTDPTTGLTTQYFERAVLQWHPDAPAGWTVQLARLGAGIAANRTDAAFTRVDAATDSSCRYFDETGHRLCNGFKDYWTDNGGLPVFGYPLSEEFSENGMTVQYFERARFEWHPENAGTPYVVLLGRLGADAANRAGVSQTPVPKSDEVDEYNPDLWYVPAPPPPPSPAAVVVPPAGAPSGQAKWIEVNLSSQYLRAWEYSTLVFGQYISSGVAKYPTVTGTFSIYVKYASQDMTNGRAAPPGEYYYLPDVPWVMYFYQDYAIHGTYWHSNFGTPMSHGCVNMTIGGANWIYNWAPYGTTVWIHY